VPRWDIKSLQETWLEACLMLIKHGTSKACFCVSERTYSCSPCVRNSMQQSVHDTMHTVIVFHFQGHKMHWKWLCQGSACIPFFLNSRPARFVGARDPYTRSKLQHSKLPIKL
jgi:hypothetical protein